MQIRSVKECSFEDLQARTEALIVACGYEHRSQGITSALRDLPKYKHALCFREHAMAIARPENEAFFRQRGFALHNVGTEETEAVRQITQGALSQAVEVNKGVAFDISTMTRSWHGAIIRQLRLARLSTEVETFFAYTPAAFVSPLPAGVLNEFVAPVTGFSSLSTPDKPVAAIIGLGYEKDGALGLQQLLDPALTVVLMPNSGADDRYYPVVRRNNRDLLERTHEEWVFEYSIEHPASTFATLASIIGGIRESYRIVLASLGPKIFGLVCFLLATKFPDISVWRISSGVHSRPRDSEPDLTRAVVLDVTWAP
jgi:hypothetical protein